MPSSTAAVSHSVSLACPPALAHTLRPALGTAFSAGAVLSSLPAASLTRDLRGRNAVLLVLQDPRGQGNCCRTEKRCRVDWDSAFRGSISHCQCQYNEVVTPSPIAYLKVENCVKKEMNDVGILFFLGIHTYLRTYECTLSKPFSSAFLGLFSTIPSFILALLRHTKGP